MDGDNLGELDKELNNNNNSSSSSSNNNNNTNNNNDKEALQSLLFKAIGGGSKKAVERLLAANADVNCRDEIQNTPLLFAVEKGEKSVVKALLREGADLQAKNEEGEGVLEICFALGHAGLGQYLISKGATSEGWEEHAAAAGKDVEAIKAAMELGIDLQVLDESEEDRSTSKLRRAKTQGSKMLSKTLTTEFLNDLSTELQRSSLDDSSIPSLNLDPLKVADDRGLDERLHDAHKKKHIPINSSNRQAKELKQELPKREETRQQDADTRKLVTDSIVLMGQAQAAHEAVEAGKRRVGQEAEELDDMIQQHLDEQLVVAISSGKHKKVEDLTLQGAFPNSKDENGLSALMLASAMGNRKIVKILLRAGADIQETNSEGLGPADFARVHEHHELAEYLESKGAILSERIAAHVTAQRLTSSGSVRVSGEDLGLDENTAAIHSTTFPRDEQVALGISGFLGLNGRTASHDSDNKADDSYDSIISSAQDLGIDLGDASWKSGQSFSLEQAITNSMEDNETDEDDNKSIDLEVETKRVLDKYPVPRSAGTLRLLTGKSEDETDERSSFLAHRHDTARKHFRPRSMSGAAVVIANSNDDGTDGLGCRAQFLVDIDRLNMLLPTIGYDDIQVKWDMTRTDMKRFLTELVVALQPGGNLAHKDSLMLYIMSTGGVQQIDGRKTEDKVWSELEDSPLAIREVLDIVRNALPGKPKLVVMHLCADPAGRKLSNVEAPLQASKSGAALYQDMVSDCPDSSLVVCISKGPVHWIPKRGSIFVDHWIEAIREERFDTDLAGIFGGLPNRIKKLFIDRKGKGPVDCPVGIKAYEDFYLQIPLLSAAPDAHRMMFGSHLQWCPDHTKYPFEFSMVDCCVTKTSATYAPISAASLPLPNLLDDIPVHEIRRIAWEFKIMDIGGSKEVFVGAVTAEEKKQNLLADRNDKSLVRLPSPPRKKKKDSPRQVGVQQVVGKAFGFSITAVGGSFPEQFPSHGDMKHPGFHKGSSVVCWLDKEKQTIEFTVDGKHIGRMFENVEGQDFVPAISAGQFATCSIALAGFWCW